MYYSSLEMVQKAFDFFLIFPFLEPLLWYRDPTLGTGSTPFGPGFPVYASCAVSSVSRAHKTRFYVTIDIYDLGSDSAEKERLW